MKVVFRYPSMYGEGTLKTAEMEAVPRVDEVIYDRNDDVFRVRDVSWYPFGEEWTGNFPHAYVVLDAIKVG